jgi:hypothetical protein
VLIRGGPQFDVNAILKHDGECRVRPTHHSSRVGSPFSSPEPEKWCVGRTLHSRHQMEVTLLFRNSYDVTINFAMATKSQ